VWRSGKRGKFVVTLRQRRSSTDFYERLGSRLRTFRRRAGLSQAALGARLGLTAGAINRYEMGRRRVPLKDVSYIASILGITPGALLGTRLLGSGEARRATAVQEESPAYGGRRAGSAAEARAYATSLPRIRLRALAKQAGLDPEPPPEALRRYAELIARDFARRGGSTRGRLK
jgi:transcriptional regulator with XRE-family HTH domain